MATNDNTIEFPTNKTPPTEPEEDIVENDFWKCGACDTLVNDTSEKKVLPINLGGNPQAGQPGMTFYVCPTCHVLSMPPDMFDEIHRRMNSRIIT